MLYPLLMRVCKYACTWGGAAVSMVKSQRWLMVYRRTLMGDSSPPASAISVATWVTCNLSSGSEATSPQLWGDETYTLPLLFFLKRLPTSHWTVKLCSDTVRLPACLSASLHVWTFCISMESLAVCPSLQSHLATLWLIQMQTERKKTLARPLICQASISINLNVRVIS